MTQQNHPAASGVPADRASRAAPSSDAGTGSGLGRSSRPARVFRNPKLIRFRHCDPAGIVYYPRYYELLHETQEDFLAHIGFPEPQLIRSGVGVPIVAMETQFSGMSRNGDEVVVALDLWKLGRSSIGMRYVIHAAGNEADVRLRAKSTVVFSSTSHGADEPARALRIPDDLRAALEPYLSEEAAP